MNKFTMFTDAIEDDGDIFMPQPGGTPAFWLASEGYDVWLDGNRGTLYQRHHKNESITEEEYWDFSYTDMALVDQVAQINYITGFTGRESLSYVGKSMGTM